MHVKKYMCVCHHNMRKLKKFIGGMILLIDLVISYATTCFQGQKMIFELVPQV